MQASIAEPPTLVRQLAQLLSQFGIVGSPHHLTGTTIEAVAEYLNWVVTARMELTGNFAHDLVIAKRAMAIYNPNGQC
ncbi:MAG: hypothetical protein WCY92_07525 [Novosphingobium sp.]